MSVKIALRTSGNLSPFRHYLLAMAGSSCGDELVICSGYIQEGVKGYMISADKLLGQLGRGSVTTVRIYGDQGAKGCWAGQLQAFATAIRKNIAATSAFQVSNFNWHAKIAILLCNGEPVAGILGSSNLTRPAFGAPVYGWNYECDVVIDPHDYLQIEGGSGSVIQTVIDENVKQPSELDRLKELLDEIEKQKWKQVV